MRKLLIMPIMVCVILAMASLVMAATAWVTPTSGSNHSSAISLDIMYDNITDITEPSAANTTLYYSTDSGATYTEVAFTGFTDNSTAVSGTLAITSIADNADVDLNITIGNDTDLIHMDTSDLVTNIRIDDTAPTFRVEPRDFISYGSLVEYVCYDNLADKSALVTVTHPSGDPTASTTLTGDDASTDPLRTFSDTDYKGDFVFSCLDYGTANAATNVTISTRGLGHPRTIEGVSGGINTNTILIIIVIAGIAYFLLRKK